MDATAALYALAAGDYVALVEALGCDEREVFVIPDMPGVPSGLTATIALIGSTVIAIPPGGDLEAHGHPSSDVAAACYQRATAGMRQQVAEIAADPRAAARRVLGFDPALVELGRSMFEDQDVLIFGGPSTLGPIIDAYGVDENGRVTVRVDDGQPLPAVVAWDDLTFGK